MNRFECNYQQLTVSDRCWCICRGSFVSIILFGQTQTNQWLEAGSIECFARSNKQFCIRCNLNIKIEFNSLVDMLIALQNVSLIKPKQLVHIFAYFSCLSASLNTKIKLIQILLDHCCCTYNAQSDWISNFHLTTIDKRNANVHIN